MTTFSAWNKTCFLDHLPQAIQHKIDQLMILEHCQSTNDVLLEKQPPAPNQYHLCIAEQQISGRGQQQRKWQSPPFSGIWCSFSCQLPLSKPNPFNTLSLIVGLAVTRALQQLGAPTTLKIKWPNDLYIEQQKFAGILVESSSSAGIAHAVIGIGITLLPHPAINSLPNSTALQLAWPECPQREPLLAAVTRELLHDIEHFDERSVTLASDFKKVDFLYNKPIKVGAHSSVISGLAGGISSNGELIVKQHNGVVTKMHSGQILSF